MPIAIYLEVCRRALPRLRSRGVGGGTDPGLSCRCLRATGTLVLRYFGIFVLSLTLFCLGRYVPLFSLSRFSLSLFGQPNNHTNTTREIPAKRTWPTSSTLGDVRDALGEAGRQAAQDTPCSNDTIRSPMLRPSVTPLSTLLLALSINVSARPA